MHSSSQIKAICHFQKKYMRKHDMGMNPPIFQTSMLSKEYSNANLLLFLLELKFLVSDRGIVEFYFWFSPTFPPSYFTYIRVTMTQYSTPELVYFIGCYLGHYLTVNITQDSAVLSADYHNNM
jgi:hypothetical protein